VILASVSESPEAASARRETIALWLILDSGVTIPLENKKILNVAACPGKLLRVKQVTHLVGVGINSNDCSVHSADEIDASQRHALRQKFLHVHTNNPRCFRMSPPSCWFSTNVMNHAGPGFAARWTLWSRECHLCQLFGVRRRQ